MKKKTFLAAVIVALGLFFPTAANATDVFYGDDSAPPGKYGLVWVEDQLRGNPVSYMSSGRDLLCSDSEDANCMGTGKHWQAYVILPPCDSTRVDNCVESMGVRISSSDTSDSSVPYTAGKLIRSISGNILKGSPSLDIPTSGTVSVWDVPSATHTGGNSHYSVAVRLLFTGNGSQVQSTKIESAIVPIVERSGPYGKMNMAVVDTGWGRSIVHNWHVGNCVWQEANNCAVAQFWPQGSSAVLKVRVPQSISGWLYGRLVNPDVDVTTSSSTKSAVSTKTITVSGSPVTVEGSKPLVDCLSMPADVEAVTGKCITQGGQLGGYVSQIPTDLGEGSNRWFNAFFPFTQDKSDGLVDYWNFKTIQGFDGSAQASSCLNSSENLIGIVSSNSLLYAGQPPKFENGQMNYNVRALHFMPDGTTPFQGTYDLNVRSSAARCLYGLGTAPVSAAVSVTSANGQTQVATSFFNEKNGWMHFGAYGFTFSSPTVKIKLIKGDSGIAPIGDFKTPILNGPNSPAATPSKTPLVTPTSKSKTSTITCVKGKLTKKVTAVNATCPAGYKKKS